MYKCSAREVVFPRFSNTKFDHQQANAPASQNLHLRIKLLKTMELKRKLDDQALVPVANRSKAELIAYGGASKAVVEGVSVGDNARCCFMLLNTE